MSVNIPEFKSEMAEASENKSQDLFPASELGASDADLVKACLSGSEDAWDRLVTRYQRLVFAVPRRAGLNDEQAADVFQEVFLTLFEKMHEITQREKVRSWIITTAKFKTWAAIRARRNLYSPASEDEMESELEQLSDKSPLADEMLIELEQQHLIRSAVSRLDEPCAKILSMIYLTEPAASYARVAAAIGVGETSISPMRARCLKKLEKFLSK